MKKHVRLLSLLLVLAMMLGVMAACGSEVSGADAVWVPQPTRSPSTRARISSIAVHFIFIRDSSFSVDTPDSIVSPFVSIVDYQIAFHHI